MRHVPVRLLTASAFEPFGEVLTVPGAPGRDYFERALCNLCPGAWPSPSLSRTAPLSGTVLRVGCMERHAYSSRSFVPLGPARFLVLPGGAARGCGRPGHGARRGLPGGIGAGRDLRGGYLAPRHDRARCARRLRGFHVARRDGRGRGVRAGGAVRSVACMGATAARSCVSGTINAATSRRCRVPPVAHRLVELRAFQCPPRGGPHAGRPAANTASHRGGRPEGGSQIPQSNRLPVGRCGDERGAGGAGAGAASGPGASGLGRGKRRCTARGVPATGRPLRFRSTAPTRAGTLARDDACRGAPAGVAGPSPVCGVRTCQDKPTSAAWTPRPSPGR